MVGPKAGASRTRHADHRRGRAALLRREDAEDDREGGREERATADALEHAEGDQQLLAVNAETWGGLAQSQSRAEGEDGQRDQKTVFVPMRSLR